MREKLFIRMKDDAGVSWCEWGKHPVSMVWTIRCVFWYGVTKSKTRGQFHKRRGESGGVVSFQYGRDPRLHNHILTMQLVFAFFIFCGGEEMLMMTQTNHSLKTNRMGRAHSEYFKPWLSHYYSRQHEFPCAATCTDRIAALQHPLAVSRSSLDSRHSSPWHHYGLFPHCSDLQLCFFFFLSFVHFYWSGHKLHDNHSVWNVVLESLHVCKHFSSEGKNTKLKYQSDFENIICSQFGF